MGAPLGPVQLIPPGLTGLLQIKQLGRLPSDLLGDVYPMLELRDWNMQARQLQDFGLFGVIPNTPAVGPGAPGAHFFQVGGADFLVPANQVWYVEQMTVIVSLAAADVTRFAPIIAGPSGIPNQEYVQVGPDFSDVVTARARVAIAKNDRSFWATAGQKFGVWIIDNTTAGTNTYALHMRATPMPL